MVARDLPRSALLGALLPPLLLSTSCGGLHGGLGETWTLAGRIEGWSLGTGFTLRAQMVSETAPTGRVIATAPVAADGSFAMALPGGSAVSDSLGAPLERGEFPRCTSAPLVDPVDLKTGSLQLVGERQGHLLLVRLADRPPDPKDLNGITAADYVYADSDGTKTGRRRCADLLIDVDTAYQVVLRRGWNVLLGTYHEFTSQPFRVRSTIRDGEPGAGMKWYKIDAVPASQRSAMGSWPAW